MDNKTIFVKNLPPTYLKKKEIRSHFNKYGVITKIETNSRASTCYVTFATASQAKAAKADGESWNNRKVDIEWNDDMDKVLYGELHWFAEEVPMDEPREKLKKMLKSVKSGPRKIPEVDLRKNKTEEEEVKLEVQSEKELLSKEAISNVDKLNLLEERDKLIRSKLVKNVKSVESIKGTCPDMCPEKERIMREVRAMVAPYETLNEDGRLDHNLAVKEYKRSSADQEEPLPHELRPEAVLTMTMEYLIINIMGKIENEEENIGYWYDFCWGRLRAIRKDIIQQQLCDLNTVTIVEQSARFHILCFDRLWGCPKTVFDVKINSETLMNCLQTLMHMYEDLRKQNILCPNEAEFRAYLILLKLNSGYLLSEYQQFSEDLQCSLEVKDAVNIHTAFSNNMYSTYFKLLRNTSYLNSCLMQRFFTHLRAKALNVIVRAYCPSNSKLCRIPIEYIEEALKFDELDDAILFCDSFGIGVSKDNVTFLISRINFFFPDSMYTVDTPSSLVIKKRISVAEAVCGYKNLPLFIPHEVHTSFTDRNTLKPSSLDAYDQEEKMLRDTVERLLLKKRAKESETVVKEDEAEDFVDGLNDQEEFEEEKMDDEDETYDAEQFLEESDKEDFDGNSSVYSENSYKSNSPVDVSLSSPTLKFPFRLPEYKEEKMAYSLHTPPPIKSNIPVNPVNTFNLPAFKRPPLSPTISAMKKPQTPPSRNISPASTPTSNPLKTFQKNQNEKNDPDENMIMTKLRKKLNEKMKKTTCRKYARIWKAKVDKIKSMRLSEKSALFHIPLEDYSLLWGSSLSHKQKMTLERLNKRKKASLLVTAILHTNIVDQLDNQVKKVGSLITSILGNRAIIFAHKFGNILQPFPVFWKLVIALPASLPEGSTFPSKLRSWCKGAFYQGTDQDLGDVYLSCYNNLVPVFTNVNVIEGFNEIENSCNNISSLVLVTGKGWEKSIETLKRMDTILSKITSKIPVAVLSMGTKECFDVETNNRKISYLHKGIWESTDNLLDSLKVLAQNTPVYNLKVEPLGTLVEVATEKFLDALHEDRFIDDDLYNALTKPNNIIRFYNLFIDKIKEEIINCSLFNIYGTAYEFKDNIKKHSYNFDLFPQHYNEPNFKEVLLNHCNSLKLTNIKDKYESSLNFLATFREYCLKLKCPHILSKLMRMINPPDDDDGIDLNTYLRGISWLPVIEVLMKENLKTGKGYSYNVVYRGDKVNDLIQSHWWLVKENQAQKCF